MKEEKKSKVIKGIIKCLIKEDLAYFEALEALNICKDNLHEAKLITSNSRTKLKDALDMGYFL